MGQEEGALLYNIELKKKLLKIIIVILAIMQLGTIFINNNSDKIFFPYLCRKTTSLGRCDDLTKIYEPSNNKYECLQKAKELLKQNNESFYKDYSSYQCARGCNLKKDSKMGLLVCKQICFANGQCTN